MKKILFIPILFSSLIFKTQSKLPDCSSQIKNLVKNTTEQSYGTIYDYNILSFKNSTVSDLDLTSDLALYYSKVALNNIQTANEYYANKDYNSGDFFKKESDINLKKSSTMSSLSSNASFEKKNIIGYEVKYNVKADDESANGTYLITYYFNKKCYNLSKDELYDYVIQNVDR